MHILYIDMYICTYVNLCTFTVDLKDDIRDLARFAPGTPKKTKKKNYLNENAKNVGAHKIARPPSVEHLVSLQKKREREFEEYKRGVVPT